jgi:protein TonB
MFEQTFVPGPVRTKRTWSVLLSFGLQMLFIGGLVLAPLIVTDRVPAAQLKELFFAPSVPRGRAAKVPPEHVEIVDAKEVRGTPKTVTEPTSIPEKVAQIEDPPDAFRRPASDGPDFGIPNSIGPVGTSDAAIRNLIKTAQPPPPVTTETVAPVKAPREQPPAQVPVGGKVQEAKLIHKVIPAYPALARTARISGTVHLSAIIGTDGTVRELKVMSGHALLIQAAVDAVRQWRYQPTTLNGQPVEVITTIDVNFVVR